MLTRPISYTINFYTIFSPTFTNFITLYQFLLLFTSSTSFYFFLLFTSFYQLLYYFYQFLLPSTNFYYLPSLFMNFYITFTNFLPSTNFHQHFATSDQHFTNSIPILIQQMLYLKIVANKIYLHLSSQHRNYSRKLF